MKKILLILIPVLLVVFFLTRTSQSNNKYKQQIEKYWEDRHDFFSNSEASPFHEKKEPYKEVEIFPISSDYKVQAKLNRFSTRETMAIGNSDGSNSNYLKFAIATFKINDTKQSLLILKALGFGNQYLTAFGDETSGITTYGGGRYLDLEIGKSDHITIDFNKAYNPYCAYFGDYTCPLPPGENLLTVAIEAGEKDYNL